MADMVIIVFGEANEQKGDRPADIRFLMIQGVEQNSYNGVIWRRKLPENIRDRPVIFFLRSSKPFTKQGAQVGRLPGQRKECIDGGSNRRLVVMIQVGDERGDLALGFRHERGFPCRLSDGSRQSNFEELLTVR